MMLYDWIENGRRKGRSAPVFVTSDERSGSYDEMELATTRLAAIILAVGTCASRLRTSLVGMALVPHASIAAQATATDDETTLKPSSIIRLV